MLLNIKSVKFKNFFSFGAKYQEFHLRDGISLIVGKDQDLNISNGAGKCVSGDTEIDIIINDINILDDLNKYLNSK